ncbi:terpenoid synthase [Aspergillus ibericus CBS 121593]|uniref:Terpenoid synthase n=1 Tax=Aspergillus ibericus CBS 121593 TaxID=1448316 RepID=A0A395GRL3_9EURO|nr:terpenoid synthase [Aspergillus ibericus CBS 121593]RAK97347.1 terpenoid synthase [Aspergillus ibericus CBS 121593]
MRKIAKLAADASCRCYPFHPPDLQSKIALFFTYFFTIDDLIRDFPTEAQNFRRDVLQQKPLSPVFESCRERLIDLDGYYDPYSADMVSKSVPRVLTSFRINFRFKTGLPEALIYLLAPRSVFGAESTRYLVQLAPELAVIINGINDILSFYKEVMVAQEPVNFVQHFAMVKGESVVEALEGVVERVVGCLGNGRRVVAGWPLLRGYVEAFV